MKRHFEKDVEALKTRIIKMASLAEEAVRLSIESFLRRDSGLARKVIDNDDQINAMEIEVDDAIVDLLALNQPVASDLRLILAAQKINNDLERIGDHGVNIAQSAVTIAERGVDFPTIQIPRMGEIVESMLRDAINGFIYRDAALGMEVIRKDDLIDDLNRAVVQACIQGMKAEPHSIDAGIDLIRVSRNLERVADLATNIAEEVIFISQARVVKHHAADRRVRE